MHHKDMVRRDSRQAPDKKVFAGYASRTGQSRIISRKERVGATGRSPGFLRGWNRALKFYQDNPEVMIPYIQKKLAVSDVKMARRMYDDDHGSASLTGVLNADAAREILDIAWEALRIKETVALERVFDFFWRRRRRGEFRVTGLGFRVEGRRNSFGHRLQDNAEMSLPLANS